jgi:hypothetical protein
VRDAFGIPEPVIEERDEESYRYMMLKYRGPHR